MSEQLVSGLREAGALAIIRGTDAAASVATSLELFAAGFRYLEISLTTVDALDVIAQVAQQAPADAQIGAGTVLTAQHVTQVRDAGATFAVTPAVAASVDECARLEFPVIAGVLTPTEVVSAMERGAAAVKLFPASIGGPSYLKALRDPLPTVPFIAVGGVSLELVPEYFAAGAIAVGLGGPLVGDAAAGGDLAALRARAGAFLEAARIR